MDSGNEEEKSGDSGEYVPLMFSPSLVTMMEMRENRDSEVESEDGDEEGECVPVILSPSLAREIRGGEAEVEEVRGGCGGSEGSGETITVYFDSAEPVRFGREKKILLGQDDGGLDTTILRKFRHDESLEVERQVEWAALLLAHTNAEFGRDYIERPMGRLINDLMASSRLSVARDRKYAGIEGTRGVLPHSVPSGYFMNYLSELQQLDAHNNNCAKETRIPHVLSHQLFADFWIRDQVNIKWAQKYRTTLAPKRALLKARRVQAEMTDNEEEIKVITKERRALDRSIFTECVEEQLNEIENTLKQDLIQPLAEIKELQIISEGQSAILLREHLTLPELAEHVEECQRAVLTKMKEAMEDIDVRLNAMNDLLYFADARTKRIKTRLNRLDAKDVIDYQERMQVRRERLDRPEACDYVADTCQDILSIQEIAGGTLKCSEEIYSGLERLAGTVLNLRSSTKGCMLVTEMPVRTWFDDLDDMHSPGTKIMAHARGPMGQELRACPQRTS